MPTTVERGSIRRSDDRIGDALVRLNRAVQRASIYPPGHPGVRAAATAFLESLEAVLGERPALLVGVTADRLVVEGVSLEDRRAALGWLTEHLRGRGLASMAFEPGLTEGELVRFVEWLGRPVAEGPDGREPMHFAGLVLTRYDYGKARFVDAPSTSAQDPDKLWQALASSFSAGWYLEEGRLSDEPDALARELSAYVLRNEGVGAAALLARIEATGAHLPQLPEVARATLKRRLSAFVAALTPDLRSQLLRVDKGTSRQKADLLAEILDDLPDSQVLEVLADLDVEGAPPPRHLLNLFSKLIALAGKDPLSRELAEARLPGLGLPAGLTTFAPEKVKEALREVFDARGEYLNPEAYQRDLEGLDERGAPARYECRHYRDLRDPLDVRAHASSVVLRLVVSEPAGEAVPDYLRRLLDDLPADVAASRFDFVYERAAALRELQGRPTGLSDVARTLAAEYLARLQEPGLVSALLRSAQESAGPLSPGLVGLVRAGGVDAACVALDHLATLPDGESRERVADLVFLLEEESFAAALGRLRVGESPSLRALVPLLKHPAAPSGPELLLSFVGNKDPVVRLEAFRLLLEGDPQGPQYQRLVAKALGDPEPGVVRLGLERCHGAGGLALAKTMADFVDGWLHGGFDAELGKKAVATLASLPGGREAIARMLRARRRALSPAAVRRSMTLEAALLRSGDEESLAAVRSFRRSVAGWISMLLPEEELEPS